MRQTTVRFVLKEWLCLGVAFLALALFNGCATHEWRGNVPLTTVGTLRPTFEWTAPKESGVSYDFIICVGIDGHRGFWVPGKTVYYRQGLTTTTHTLDQPLSPDTVYVWSVRTRSGKRTSLWAAYSDGNPSHFQKGRRRYNVMCPFKTPGN
jgi:hypothetical protein